MDFSYVVYEGLWHIHVIIHIRYIFFNNLFTWILHFFSFFFLKWSKYPYQSIGVFWKQSLLKKTRMSKQKWNKHLLLPVNRIRSRRRSLTKRIRKISPLLQQEVRSEDILQSLHTIFCFYGCSFIHLLILYQNALIVFERGSIIVSEEKQLCIFFWCKAVPYVSVLAFNGHLQGCISLSQV